MLRLFVKDNNNGCVHEYGTDPHDALILMDDGSLHYEHLQCCVGTMFPEEGFSFCYEDGSIPADIAMPYIDIGGECCTKPQTNADRIRAMSDEELADFMTRRNVTESCLRLADEGYTPTEEQKQVLYDSLYPVWMEWLKQPAEGE